MEGIVYARIVEGSFTGSLFRDFLCGLLDNMQPYPAPKSVIVLDNARVHKQPATLQMIEER